MKQNAKFLAALVGLLASAAPASASASADTLTACTDSIVKSVAVKFPDCKLDVNSITKAKFFANGESGTASLKCGKDDAAIFFIVKSAPNCGVYYDGDDEIYSYFQD